MRRRHSAGAQAQFVVDAATGEVHPARQVLSPNCDARPPGVLPELVVIHGISLPPGRFGGGWIDALFTNTLDHDAHPYFAGLRGLRVSSHLLIDRHGTLTQYVPLHRRAWHAGRSCWRGRPDCNDFSIGIELEGTDTTAYTDAQYATLAAVIDALLAAWPTLAPDALAGHCDIAPERKTDPGPAFDWPRLRALLDARLQLRASPASYTGGAPG